jgi:hypothetical protein
LKAFLKSGGGRGKAKKRTDGGSQRDREFQLHALKSRVKHPLERKREPVVRLEKVPHEPVHRAHRIQKLERLAPDPRRKLAEYRRPRDPGPGVRPVGGILDLDVRGQTLAAVLAIA